MKMTKKLISIVMVIAILASLAVTAFAEDESTATGTDGTTKHNITISGAIEGARYDGYRLLDTTTSLKVQGCHNTDAEHLSTCYNVAYSVNDKYLDILKTVTNKTTEAEIIEYIKGCTSADRIQTFADTVYASITSAQNGIVADATDAGGSDSTAVLTGVAQGYWLIVETISAADYDGAYSLVMLDTAGSRDITIATKRDEPNLIKHVRDNGMSYGHGADVQIGDDSEFLLITDVPNPLGYETYTYIIHDQMAEGLTFNADSVKIQLNSVDGTELAETYYTVETTNLCTDCDFHIVVKIKEATAASVLKGDDRLYISYTAKLNEKANVLMDGTNTDNANKNTAWLEYSNDPYNADETAKSTPMDVYVWTYPLKLNKVDSAGTSLSGAKFVLSRDSSLTEDELKDSDNDGKPDGNEKMIPLFLVDNTNDTYRVAPTGYTDDVVYEIDAGTAKLQGFDDQVEYYLYETVAPAGYNQLSAPVSFKFFAQYESSESPLFAAGYPKVSINTATETNVLEANIVNQTGAELPSTGGIGTTIFYVAGGLLVAAAIVLLITRKRMGTAD